MRTAAHCDGPSADLQSCDSVLDLAASLIDKRASSPNLIRIKAIGTQSRYVIWR